MLLADSRLADWETELIADAFLVPGFKPRGTYKISPVRPCVHPSVTHYLRNRRISPKLDMKLGVKNVRNVVRAFFLGFCLFSRKPLIYAKKYIFGHFWQFLGLCGKSVPRTFLKSS